jgi:alkanesulfonate monooxygenase SsuD/methylene tetrahydromethanopterin reductase-like flavin-dependent oxidoreductase (luciferase family)
VTSLLRGGSCTLDGEHIQVSVESLGLTPPNPRIPLLIGGHGRRVVGIAAKFADVFQFTGLTHGAGGDPSGGGFALTSVTQRNRWFEEAAADRLPNIVRSALVQATHLGDPSDFNEAASKRIGLDVSAIEETPFMLAGSVEQIVDKIGRLETTLGITNWTIRDTEGFAPVLDAMG